MKNRRNISMAGNTVDSKGTDSVPSLSPDPSYMLKLAEAKMPFGKFAGVRLIDLPEPYVVWFSRKGFPGGELGSMLQSVYEIKVNGLEYLFRPLRK